MRHLDFSLSKKALLQPIQNLEERPLMTLPPPNPVLPKISKTLRDLKEKKHGNASIFANPNKYDLSVIQQIHAKAEEIKIENYNETESERREKLRKEELLERIKMMEKHAEEMAALQSQTYDSDTEVTNKKRKKRN